MRMLGGSYYRGINTPSIEGSTNVNVLVHLNANLPGTKTSRRSGTRTFTSTCTFTC